MYAHLCKGPSLCNNAHMYNEIMLPYAGIIRIRFLGMISATVFRGTPANISTNIYLILFIYAILENYHIYFLTLQRKQD